MENRYMRLLTSKEVAALLGFSEWTVRKWAREGELPAVKVGRAWRFPARLIELELERGGGAALRQTTFDN